MILFWLASLFQLWKPVTHSNSGASSTRATPALTQSISHTCGPTPAINHTCGSTPAISPSRAPPAPHSLPRCHETLPSRAPLPPGESSQSSASPPLYTLFQINDWGALHCNMGLKMMGWEEKRGERVWATAAAHLFPSSFSVMTTSLTRQYTSPFTFFPSLGVWPRQIPAMSPRFLDENSNLSTFPLEMERKACWGFASAHLKPPATTFLMSPYGHLELCVWMSLFFHSDGIIHSSSAGLGLNTRYWEDYHYKWSRRI